MSSAAVIKTKNNRIDALIKEQTAFIAAIDIATKDAEIKIQQKENQYAEAKESADIKYQDTIARLKLDANSLRIERDKARSAALSRIAESSRSPNELCFSREGFESAVQRLDESLSGIIGQCLNTETRLTITKDWYDNIKGIE